MDASKQERYVEIAGIIPVAEGTPVSVYTTSTPINELTKETLFVDNEQQFQFNTTIIKKLNYVIVAGEHTLTPAAAEFLTELEN